MEKIKLNNGVEMPVFGFGTYKVKDPSECERSVTTAIGAGYRLIDTAQFYDNEAAVGAAIKNCGVAREELFVTTKVWFRSFETEDCRASLDGSLRKLGMDYLDLVLLHWPFGNVYAAWRVLEEYYAAGKIRAIGVSNMDPDRLIDLITFNKVCPAVNQIETHLYCQRKTARRWLAKYGVAPQAYSPLGQGRANQMFEEPIVRTIAAAHGKTAGQILLRFLVQSGISVIPKSVHPDRIQANIRIFDFALSDNEMERLASLDTGKALIGNPGSPEKVETAMTW